MKYTIKKCAIKNIFNGKVRKVNFEVRNEKHELYCTVDDKNDAKIIVYGLNNGYERNVFGGFSDSIYNEIKAKLKIK